MSYIFISYNHKNRNYALKLANTLKEQGFDIWIDEDINAGDRWYPEIIKAILNSGCVIVIMTPEAEKSEWVEKEILIAQREEKPIFPLLLSGREFSLLITIQSTDVRGEKLPAEKFYKSLAQVVPRQKPTALQPTAYELLKDNPVSYESSSIKIEDEYVLIVEDDREIGDFTREMVEKLTGIEAHHEINGQKALAIATNNKPRLLILDLHLPKISGWKVLDEFRKIYPKNTPPVIIMTANVDPANKLIGRLASVSAYLSKPFTPIQLLNTIQSVLEIPDEDK